MATEFETKVLDIDVPGILDKLKKLGAEDKTDMMMRRFVFDINPEKNEWIRLRDDGKKVTLTYKNRTGSEIGSTEEIEVKVSGFDDTAKILKRLPFKGVFYQENRRKLFLLQDCEVSIDSWPRIPPYLEIEGDSKEQVTACLSLLNLEGDDEGDISVVEVYKRYGIDLHSMTDLRFKK